MSQAQFTADLLEELNVLCLFNLDTNQEGIKVHSNASPGAIAATARLHAKGLVTQADGGYMTALGREAAHHAQELLGLLAPVPLTT
ncbi:TIGR02647 family protein [Billgrantia pellis]|uniref:TIGR02647 family protein n=1 Tax=Billgrantia pellis TaxID=2606936 RepID=A0A7V7FZV4_9GAMM|nr:TIGR02647 family protein [Halomonas pellis]KAA0012582.1 TIGR02647 family protein [Halomonas pellis]